MSSVPQTLVDHFEKTILNNSESEEHEDFLSDLQSFSRVSGLVMGNGQVSCTLKIIYLFSLHIRKSFPNVF